MTRLCSGHETNAACADCAMPRLLGQAPWFAARPDADAFRLLDAAPDILRRALAGGPVRVGVPFPGACLEHRDWLSLRCGGETVHLEATGFELHLPIARLRHVFADVQQACVRFFDTHGRPMLVVRPEGARASETMAAIVARFAARWAPSPLPKADPAPGIDGWIEAAIRVDALRADWCALRGPEALPAMLEHYDLTCDQALRLVGPAWARPVEPDTVTWAVTSALETGDPVHVHTGDPHTGASASLEVRTSALAGPHQVLEGRTSRLCLDRARIERVWVVVRPGALRDAPGLIVVDPDGSRLADVVATGERWGELLASALLRAEAA